MLLSRLLLGLAFTVLARAENFNGKCELFANGQSQGERDCRIETNTPSARGNCPGRLGVWVYYRYRGTDAYSVLFELDGDSFSGSCSQEGFDHSVNGTLGGGSINGSMTFQYKKGPETGTTVEIRFAGSTRR